MYNKIRKVEPKLIFHVCKCTLFEIDLPILVMKYILCMYMKFKTNNVRPYFLLLSVFWFQHVTPLSEKKRAEKNDLLHVDTKNTGLPILYNVEVTVIITGCSIMILYHSTIIKGRFL